MREEAANILKETMKEVDENAPNAEQTIINLLMTAIIYLAEIEDVLKEEEE